MHREEDDLLVPCADCGVSVDPGLERTFSFGNLGILCWDCSIRRGGSYDAKTETWGKSPSLEGLKYQMP